MGVAERRSREKAERKKSIVDAAERIFFAKGIDNASMDEVAAEAELSKGTLYLYFKNKSELYRAILRRAFSALNEILNKSINPHMNGFDRIKNIGDCYINFSKTHRGYFEAILFYENDLLELKPDEKENLKSIIAGNALLSVVVESIELGIADKSLRPEIDPTRTALLLWSELTGVMLMIKKKILIIHHYFNITPEAFIENFIENQSRALGSSEELKKRGLI
ncbi:MAG: TetR/AcrR family transcriptional regulator [Luteibaculaceae bacterium]|jgi:TetR/AcrR family transcriptional regulator